jgi:hypothetical protein
MTDCSFTKFDYNSLYIEGAAVLAIIPVYIATLRHVKRGSGYKQIQLLIYMLIFSNVGALISLFGLYMKLVAQDSQNNGATSSDTLVWDLCISLGEMVQDVLFLTSHWIIASKYARIGDEMPYIMSDKDWPEERKEAHERNYGLLLVLNALFPVGEGITAVFSNIHANCVSERAFGVDEVLLIAFDALDGVLTVLSGVVLIRAIFKIRKFYKENDS